MQALRLSLVAGAVAVALNAAPAAAQYSNTFIFGDSLSDAGQFGSRFTTNPGLTASMYAGQWFGIVSTPSFTGGNDYAVGGARVNTPNPGIPSTVPYQTVAQQVTAFIAKGPVDANALYQIQGGGNDLLAYVGQFQAGQITQAQLQGLLSQAAVDLATQVGRLQAAGARYIVVQWLPDPGKSPLATSPALAAQLTALGDLFNSTLGASLNALGGNVIRFNYTGLQREVLANPSAFGIVNTTGLACTVSAAQCTPSTLVTPNAAQTFVFADSVHPTTAMAQIVADATVSMLQGPAQMGTLSAAPYAVEQAQFRALDGRMWSSLGTPGTGARLQPWVAYDYGSNDFGGGNLGNGNGDTNSVAVGLDFRVANEVLAGVAYGYSDNKSDFGNGAGNFKLRENMITAYGGWGRGPWYLGGSLFLGDLDYSTTRSFALGAATRNENGDTNGTHWGVRLLGGYWFNYETVLHGPFLKLVYQEATVSAFSESGADSTALAYGKQKRDSFITSLGWQAQGQWGPVRPFARATWEWESKNDQQYVTASSASLGGSYTVPTYKPDSNWGQFLLGASMDFGKVTGFVSGSATAGKSNGEGYGFTIGVRVPM
jgi:outer membrane lipase/esterase